MIPRSSSEKSINLASKDSGSLPNSVTASAVNPAFSNCFLALVTLAKFVPVFSTISAFAPGDNSPTTTGATEPVLTFTSTSGITGASSTLAARANLISSLSC